MNAGKSYQIDSIEYLHLTNSAGAGISKEAIVTVYTEAAEARGVGRRVSDRV